MTTKETLDAAVRYWPLVVTFVGLVAGYAVAGERLQAVEESVRVQQIQAKEIARIQLNQAVQTYIHNSFKV